MSIDDDLRDILQPLHVELGGDSGVYAVPDDQPDQPECTLFQQSRLHSGVFYRLDLINDYPELRVFYPTTIPPRYYIIHKVTSSHGPNWFKDLSQHISQREQAVPHLLFAYGEMMKREYWLWRVSQESPIIRVEELL